MHPLRTWYSRRTVWARRLLLFLLSMTLIAGLLWFTPTAYYITAPGAAIDTSRLVAVQGGTPRADHLYMLIIASQPANLFWYLYARLDDRAILETRQEFLGEIEDYSKYVELTRRMMADSQKTAKAIALHQLGYGTGVRSDGAEITSLQTGSAAEGFLLPGDVIVGLRGKPVRTVEELRSIMVTIPAGELVSLQVRRGGEVLSLDVPTQEHTAPERKGTAALGVFITDSLSFDIPITVEIKSGAITGPSAGLMFTLQIIDQMTPGGIAGDIRIAGTGTIEPDGHVGAIGGVKQKVYTAEAAGAEVIFVPRANYEDAASVATNIQVVPVDTLGDALEWLRTHGKKAGHSGPAFWQ